MNKYVWRTSLVWIAGIVVFAAICHYRSRFTRRTPATAMSSEVQPVAIGPATGAENRGSARSDSAVTRADAEHWCRNGDSRI
jgi:hypothetical protein